MGGGEVAGLASSPGLVIHLDTIHSRFLHREIELWKGFRIPVATGAGADLSRNEKIQNHWACILIAGQTGW